MICGNMPSSLRCVVGGAGMMLFEELATGISVTLCFAFAFTAWSCICFAAFCSSSATGFFLFLGGIEGFEDEEE